MQGKDSALPFASQVGSADPMRAFQPLCVNFDPKRGASSSPHYQQHGDTGTNRPVDFILSPVIAVVAQPGLSCLHISGLLVSLFITHRALVSRHDHDYPASSMGAERVDGGALADLAALAKLAVGDCPAGGYRTPGVAYVCLAQPR